MNDIAMQVRGIRHVYGSGSTAFAALHGVDLTVRHGEVLLLMGPSGSGKTTLVQIVGGLLRPTAGQVLLGGQDIATLQESARAPLRLAHFGFIFQGYSLFPMLTAVENVVVALDLMGVPLARARTQARDLLTSVGLGQRLDAFPSQLSGGQRQRVAIARALAGNPAILLADEPTAALDAHSGHNVMELFRDLAHTQGRAVVIVTHDPRILPLADRIVRIEDGRIAAPTPEATPAADPAEEV